MGIFLNTVRPIQPCPELDLKIGKLNAIGLGAIDGIVQNIRNYVNRTWGYCPADKKTPGSVESWKRDTDSDRVERAGVTSWLLNAGYIVLWADYERSWTPEQLVDLVQTDPDAFEKCYHAALELNPTLKPEGYEPPNQTDSEDDAKKKG